jgi:flagellar basal body-associated protein fliL
MYSKKFTIISIAIFVLSLLVFVATLVLVVFNPGGASNTKQEKPKKVKTETIDVGDITTQIGRAGKFYKGFVVLEIKGKKTSEAIKEKMPQIKDSIITTIAGADADSISTPEGLDKVKEQIKKKVNIIIDSEENQDVVSVLFTQNIIQ